MESSSNKPGSLTILPTRPLDHPPRDVSERPLTPYPKDDDPFRGTNFVSGNLLGRVEGQVPSILSPPLNNFITARKGSCCGLSTSLETVSSSVAGTGSGGYLRKKDVGVGKSSFDNTFESFPSLDIGKGARDYSTCLSPKLGVLGMGTEYLERIVSGGWGEEKGEKEEGEREGIVEKIRRQRVGTVRWVRVGRG